MLFNSPEFLFVFLPLFLFLYFLTPRAGKNAVLLASSLFFYFTTSGELTTVLIISIICNYLIALLLEKTSGIKKRLFFMTGIIINLLPLLYYKYSTFFLSATNDALTSIGWQVTLPQLNPILPIGISFFTFQAISYISDIYMGRVKSARNIIDFGMYHACFPQLIAGPIVRYEEIEHTVRRRDHRIDDIYNGIVQFCFGLGKKVIIADNMASVVAQVFHFTPSQLTCSYAWIGIIAYTLQIYFDFSGYSDMAIGLGRILGFHYPVNFNQPYRATSVTDFWRRWHMTLSRWFKDYVYIGLGGNRHGLLRTLLNLTLVFFLCGLWHGAAYTFIAWGLYHGSLLMMERLARSYTQIHIPVYISWPYTMIAVMVGWVFFRADNLSYALAYIRTMFSFTKVMDQTTPILYSLSSDKITYMALGILICLIPYQLFINDNKNQYFFNPAMSFFSLFVVLTGIVMMSVNGFSPFIYFKF